MFATVSRKWTTAGLACSVISSLISLVAFGLPYWIYYDAALASDVTLRYNYGFWNYCNEVISSTGTKLNCGKVTTHSGLEQTTVCLVILSILLGINVLVNSIMYLTVMKNEKLCLYVACVSAAVSGVLMMTSIICYGLGDHDLKITESVSLLFSVSNLHASFWLATIGCFVIVMAAIFIVIAIRKHVDLDENSDTKSLASSSASLYGTRSQRSKRPPASSPYSSPQGSLPYRNSATFPKADPSDQLPDYDTDSSSSSSENNFYFNSPLYFDGYDKNEGNMHVHDADDIYDEGEGEKSGRRFGSLPIIMLGDNQVLSGSLDSLEDKAKLDSSYIKEIGKENSEEENINAKSDDSELFDKDENKPIPTTFDNFGHLPSLLKPGQVQEAKKEKYHSVIGWSGLPPVEHSHNAQGVKTTSYDNYPDCLDEQSATEFAPEGTIMKRPTQMRKSARLRDVRGRNSGLKRMEVREQSNTRIQSALGGSENASSPTFRRGMIHRSKTEMYSVQPAYIKMVKVYAGNDSQRIKEDIDSMRQVQRAKTMYVNAKSARGKRLVTKSLDEATITESDV